jgi:hypothetical protein
VSWYAWVIGALVLMVILGFEGACRAILARDSQVVQLEQRITHIRSMVSPEHMQALKSVLEKLTLPYEPMLPQPLSADEQVLEEGLREHEPDTPFWKLRAEYLRHGEQQHAGEQELRESIQAAIASRRLGNMGGADGMYWSYAQSLRKGRPVTPFGAWIEDASLARRPNNPFAAGYAFDSIIGPSGDEHERARRKVAFEEVWNLIPSLPVLDRIRMADAEVARLRPLVEREAAKLAHKTSFAKPTCHLCAHRGSER